MKINTGDTLNAGGVELDGIRSGMAYRQSHLKRDIPFVRLKLLDWIQTRRNHSFYP